MTLLAYAELCELVEDGVITGVTTAEVNSSSIDLTLGNMLLSEEKELGKAPFVIFPKSREALYMVENDLNKAPYNLQPNEFVLAHTRQIFNLPNNISAEYKLKSSLARCGLEHLNAGWCDAGWNNSVLTLELKNMTQRHILCLEQGMPIGQIVFFKHTVVPHQQSYAMRGRYNNDKTVKGIKE